MCDIILASPTAVFGQPEINLGVIPGGGGTQRLARTIGKSRAMELTLTGRNFSAVEAERWGVVSRIVEPVDGKQKVVDEAIEMGKLIASKGQISVQAGKEAINAGKLLDENSPFSSYLISFQHTNLPWLRGSRSNGGYSMVYLQRKIRKKVSMTTTHNRLPILTQWCRYGGVCGEEEAQLHTPVRVRRGVYLRCIISDEVRRNHSSDLKNEV